MSGSIKCDPLHILDFQNQPTGGHAKEALISIQSFRKHNQIESLQYLNFSNIFQGENFKLLGVYFYCATIEQIMFYK